MKRHLDIAPLIPEISDGMAGAVSYGTARSLRVNFNEEEILGKTGTCSNAGTRYGWFASYAKTDVGRIVVVVFLQGGRPTFGPKAAEISGRIYRSLYDHDLLSAAHPTVAGRRRIAKPVSQHAAVAFNCQLSPFTPQKTLVILRPALLRAEGPMHSQPHPYRQPMRRFSVGSSPPGGELHLLRMTVGLRQSSQHARNHFR